MKTCLREARATSQTSHSLCPLTFANNPQRCCRRSAPLHRESSAVRRRDLSGSDLVFEVIGIEAVEAALGRFRLRMHEEADRRSVRRGQRDVVGEVVRHPVQFPCAPSSPSRPPAVDFQWNIKHRLLEEVHQHLAADGEAGPFCHCYFHSTETRGNHRL